MERRGLKAYAGDTRAKKTKARLERAQVGRLVVRGRLRQVPEGPWVHDNGVFEDFKAGREWNDRAELDWLCDVRTIERLPARSRPDFLVLPDVVGSSELTVRSTAWAIHRLKACGLAGKGLSLAYVVQDGMSPEPHHGMRRIIESHVKDGVTTLFVGGTTEWKWATAAAWAKLAHLLGLKCHVGRVGTAQLVERASAAGVDSIDSCVPLWSTENMDVWLAALRRVETQLSLFGE